MNRSNYLLFVKLPFQLKVEIASVCESAYTCHAIRPVLILNAAKYLGGIILKIVSIKFVDLSQSLIA